MRSLLFVPADDAKKLDKAMASGADALIVDLEDSIPTQGKADARLSAAAFIADAGKAEHRPRLLVRVNGFASGLCDGDLVCAFVYMPLAGLSVVPGEEPRIG